MLIWKKIEVKDTWLMRTIVITIRVDYKPELTLPNVQSEIFPASQFHTLIVEVTRIFKDVRRTDGIKFG